MPSTIVQSAWNVRIPDVVARQIRSALGAKDQELRLQSVVRRHPDQGSEIFLWANQARAFALIGTLSRTIWTGNTVGDDNEPPPATIGNYRILSPLGSGGFATVFLGEHMESGDRHAVKLLRKQDRTSALLIQREFELLAALDHPAVVDVHEYGVTQTERPYYSMDYVSGLPLDAAFKSDVFSNEDLVASFVQLSDSVSYVHRKQITHRDIKPQNVLIDNDQLRPRVHLVDFGIAAVRFKSDTNRRELSMVKAGQLLQQTLFTQQGAIVGTPGFMAPEQFVSSGDASADIYALGVTVYLLLTGRFPVDPKAIISAWKGSAQAAFDTIVSTQILQPTTAAQLPKGSIKSVSLASARLAQGLTNRQQRMLNATLLRALQGDASLRHQDAAEFGEELATAFGFVTKPAWILTQAQRAMRRVQKYFRPAPDETDPRNTKVWFITDRAGRPDAKAGYLFGPTEASQLTFGYSLINLPQWQVIGRTVPRFWDKMLGNTGYEVVRNRTLERLDFESALRNRPNRNDLLLFVHGYNTSFDEAVHTCRTAPN